MDKVECVVIGAGVVGLAIARELAMAGKEVVIIEGNSRIGEETSSRNNEVIHAGFLYPPGSLKERLCLEGRERLVAYCEQRQVPYARPGKLLPALDEAEQQALERLLAHGHDLGMPELQWLDADQVARLEPLLQCRGALYSPQSGIVDSHALMLSLLGEAEDHGAALALDTRVRSLALEDDGGFVLECESGGQSMVLGCDVLVNAAGLGAQPLAASMPAYPQDRLPPIYFAKGCFFSYQGKTPFRHLIMPVGDTLWRGGAFTLDLAGQGRFGPDLEWVHGRDYSLDPDRVQGFVDNITRYWPGLERERLQIGYAGIRPRTTGPGQTPTDWCIQGPAEHGIANLVHLMAVETPGLTSCLATASYVRNQLTSG